MLYLEDFLELIEALPEEMKDRLTELRELDLAVHKKSADQMEMNVRAFFQQCKHMRKDQRDEEYKKLRKEYEKIVDLSEEKVQLISQLHELADRYARKLDQELSKFKLELEADHAGITEILERKSLELDNPQGVTNHRSDKKRNLLSSNHTADLKRSRSYESSLLGATSDGSLDEPGGGSFSMSPSLGGYLPPITPGSNPIAAAAAQAVAATQQMSHGRRTPSMRLTYEVMTKGLMASGGRSAGSSTPSSSGVTETKRTKRQKQAAATADGTVGGRAATSSTAAAVLDVDPNEPRWCICNQVSYGDMVGCDYKDCPREWFHYECVGLTTAPKGKWYCPDCRQAMKRRHREREKH